jgi:hypothetical protein
VSDRPELLARALQALPGVRVTAVAPAAYAGAPLAPLVVFDGFLPRALPSADVLVVNPPRGGALDVLGEVPAPAPLRADRDHPLLDTIDPAALQISTLVRLRTPAWTSPVLWTAAGPALLEGSTNGRRVVILAFDPRASNLPRLRAFPLLLANALDRLGWGERDGTVLAGQAVRLPPNAAGQVVDGPGGGTAVPAGALAFANTERVGRYIVRRADGGTELAEFRVSLLGPNAADVRPHALPPLPAAAGERPPAPAVAFAGLVLLGALGMGPQHAALGLPFVYLALGHNGLSKPFWGG